MKYKVLLTGKNEPLIDEFFTRGKEHFEVQFSSGRREDILSHLEYFQPSVLFYCMEREKEEAVWQIADIKAELSRREIPLAVAGSEEECRRFFEMTEGAADVVLYQRGDTAILLKELLGFLLERVQRKQEQKEQRRIDEIKKIYGGDERPYFSIGKSFSITPEETYEPKKRHILIVDDDVQMLKVLKEQLRENYEVATAISGKLALRFLENGQTDLILLDYLMPDEDGPAVLKKLHANPKTKEIPVIFLTGISEQSKIQNALGERPHGYLLKPVNREILLTTIRSVIR